MSTAIDRVKDKMGALGWTDGGGTGSEKRDAQGKIVGRHGDSAWINDMDESIAAVERADIVAELERRDAETSRL